MTTLPGDAASAGLEAAAGDDRHAHRLEIVAHDELVVVDDLNRAAVDGGVVLDRSLANLRGEADAAGRAFWNLGLSEPFSVSALHGRGVW